MRSAFDKLISWMGVAVAAVLLAVGGLTAWANSYIDDQVHDQLSMQGITMPEGEALASLPKADADALKQYAGSPLDTGPEATAYANHYILAHMNGMADGQTYNDISGQYISMTDEQKASEEGQALGQLRQTMFMGNTLRGLLLYGGAFATMGTIAGYASIAAFLGGAVLILLFIAGLVHAHRARKAELTKAPAAAPALA